MHVMITGANRGIGLEFCRQAQARGHAVTALCREATPELKALGVRIVEGVDVTDPPSVPNIERVDWLILNAGIWRDESLDNLNFETIIEQFQVNTLGPLRVLEQVRESLHEGSKIGLMTSQMGSIADNTSGGRYGYRLSKAALNSAGVSLAHDLKSAGISVALLHPGYVATEMTSFRGSIEPEESVRGLWAVMERLGLDNSGGFWNYRGERLPW